MLRVILGLVVLAVIPACGSAPSSGTGAAPPPINPTPAAEPVAVGKVHDAAENTLAAEKEYGGQARPYRVEVLKVEKGAGGFVLVGVGATSITGGFDVAGSEFKIKKGAEDAFAALKPGQGVTVLARFTGVTPRPGAYKDYVVTFEDAEVLKGK